MPLCKQEKQNKTQVFEKMGQPAYLPYNYSLFPRQTNCIFQKSIATSGGDTRLLRSREAKSMPQKRGGS